MENLFHIIDQCQAKDRAAQQQLYKYTYIKLCTAVAVYAKDNSEKDWIFNLAMLKIFTSLKNFKRGTNYLAWARTILVRTAIDHFRKNKKHSENLSPLGAESKNLASDEFDLMLNKIETEVIIELLQRLPEKERLVFSMYELDGYSHKEIEQLSGIKMNTSKWLLSKSKKNLRSYINHSQDLKKSGNGE